MGLPRGRGSAYTDYFADYSDSDSRQGDKLGGLRRSQRLQDQPRVTRQASSSQISLSSWLMNHPLQPSQPGHGMARDSERQDLLDPPSDTQSDRETEPELFGTDNHDPDSDPNRTRLLLEIRSDVKRMNKKLDSLDKK